MPLMFWRKTPATQRRLQPIDWLGYEPGDIVDVSAVTMLSFEGRARILSLCTHFNRPAAWIEDLTGRPEGVVEISRFSLALREAKGLAYDARTAATEPIGVAA